MSDTITNTIFLKVVPVLLTASIIWMATTLTTMHVDVARMEERLATIEKSTLKMESLQKGIIDVQITTRLLEAELDVVQRDYDKHREDNHRD